MLLFYFLFEKKLNFCYPFKLATLFKAYDTVGLPPLFFLP